MLVARVSLALLALATVSFLALTFWFGGTAEAGRVIAGRFWLVYDGRPTAEVSQAVWTASLWHGRIVLILMIWCVLVGAALGVRTLWRKG